MDSIVEQDPAQVDQWIGLAPNGAESVDRLEFALAMGVPVEELLAAQDLRHHR